MMYSMSEEKPPRSRPSISTPTGRRGKNFRATKGRIILVVGFILGVAASAIVSYLISSSFGISQVSLELLSPHQTCNCNKTRSTIPSPLLKIDNIHEETATSLTQAGARGINRVKKKYRKKDISTYIANVTENVMEPRNYLILDRHNNSIPDFDPTAPVVIVTKIQGKDTVGALNQSLCLLSYAYNHRVNYDIVVFSATNISEKQLNLIRTTVYPANLTFIIDNPGIQQMVDALDDTRKNHLLQRCNVTHSSELTWQTRCLETSSSGTTNMPIQYTWQAEFRSLHLWNHPILAKYKYMLWMDTDGFCTKVWKQDPIAIMRRNSMVLLFDNFPRGQAKGTEWPYISKQAFGKTYCSVHLTEEGHLEALQRNCLGEGVQIQQVHGFFHFTDLDFYRSEPVMKWLKAMIGNSTFSRMYDDQIAVTMPAAVLAGNRSWDMRSIGMNLNVVHDFLLDGKQKERIGGFIGFWNNHASQTFPEAYGRCNAVSPG